MTVRRLLGGLAFWLAVSAHCAVAETESTEKSGVHRFDGTVRASVPALDPVLDRLIGDSPVIAIGENIHGCREMMELETRLTEYLVEKKGFRTVVLENGVMRTEGLSAWIAGEGPAAAMPIDLLTHPYQENAELVTWLRTYNQAHPQDPVHVQGMDIWDRPWEHQQRMEAISRRLGLPFERYLQATRIHGWMHAAENWDRMTGYNAVLNSNHGIPDEDFLPSCVALEAMRSEALAALAKTTAADRDDLFSLLRSIQISLAWQQYKNFRARDDEASKQTPLGPKAGLVRALNARDRAQAQNAFCTWEQYHRAKMLILCHSTHATLMKQPAGWLNFAPGASRSTLANLQALMPDVTAKSIALTEYEIAGSFAPKNFVKPSGPDSFEASLHAADVRYALVEPRGSFGRSRSQWSFQWKGGEQTSLELAQNFDAYFFVDVAHEGARIESTRDLVQW